MEEIDSTSQNEPNLGAAVLSRSAVQDNVALEMLASTITACLEPQVISSATRELARARLWLRDIRSFRHEMLAALLERPNPKQLKLIVRLERYERAAWAKQKRALKCLLRERKSVV
jgi:hypothetical protein